ncbi:MAG: Asp-tRNA(Asn)/Glu-tRNA(Gln) amidotransferase subunit GatC [Firmicutes bacterium]|nr:Asp-tRNA(Asn)/Glu-tRNA(Gln) amidotransferase subunit GatC [Bacillota bacterium]
MPAITPDEVRHVARLARLELSEEEVARFTRQLGEILQAAKRLQELDTEGVDPTFYPLPLRNVFRPDEVRPSLPRERVLQNAPEVESDMFRVPRIIEEA